MQVASTDGDSTKKPPLIQPPSLSRLLLEIDDAVAVDVERAEAPGRPHGRDGRLAAMRLVEGDQRAMSMSATPSP